MARVIKNTYFVENIPVECSVCESVSLLESPLDIGGPLELHDTKIYLFWICLACGSRVRIVQSDMPKVVFEVRKDKKIGSLHTKA